MSPENRRGLIRNRALAAVGGSIVGGAIGLWSLGYPAATRSIAAPARDGAIAFGTTNPPKPVGSTGSAQPLPQSLAPIPQPAEPHAPPAEGRAIDAVTPAVETMAAQPRSAAATKDEGNVMERARALARRADVAALMALREDVVRRAAERGLVDSPAIKGELAELERRLDEARLLRLKLDADEFRNSKPAR